VGLGQLKYMDNGDVVGLDKCWTAEVHVSHKAFLDDEVEEMWQVHVL
jgi:hypothetical protein